MQWRMEIGYFSNFSAKHLMAINPLSAKITKWSNTLKQFVGKLLTNCLSVFDHFVGLALKRLNSLNLFSIHYFKSFLISLLSFCFYYTIMKFIMKVMLFSALICTFFETCVLFKGIFIIITRYFSYIFSIFVVYLLYHIRLIRLSGDIELNPGPKPSSFKYFSICHWNLNSITSHDFLKVKLLTGYDVMHKYAPIRYYLYLRIIS